MHTQIEERLILNSGKAIGVVMKNIEKQREEKTRGGPWKFNLESNTVTKLTRKTNGGDGVANVIESD